MSEPKLIISIPDSLKSGGLVFNHTGRSGRIYPFIWNEKYAAHIYLGKELTFQEFNTDALDIFAGHFGILFPVPLAVVDKYASQSNEPVKPSRSPKPKRENVDLEELAGMPTI